MDIRLYIQIFKTNGNSVISEKVDGVCHYQRIYDSSDNPISWNIKRREWQ